MPAYVDRFGAELLVGAISLSATIVVQAGVLDDQFRFYYEGGEVASSISRIQNRYLRATLEYLEIDEPCAVASLGPVPGGTGLGSSGAFTVGLLAALHATKGQYPTGTELAEQAFHLESSVLGRTMGKQDPYACALGGVRRLQISRHGLVATQKLCISEDALMTFEQSFQLFFTGVRRDSGQYLEKNVINRDDLDEQLHKLRDLGKEAILAFQAGDVSRYADAMRQHWSVKNSRNSDSRWAHLVDSALRSGALAAKVVGAGGGGFVLCISEEDRRRMVAQQMASLGCREVPFKFVSGGVKVL